MNKKEFYSEVEHEVRKRLGEEFQVNVSEVMKVNCTLDGMTIKKTDESIARTIYLNQFYIKFTDGESLDDVVKEILEIYETNHQKNGPELGVTVRDFYDFDKLKDRITIKVINTERNLELLKTVPHIEMKGLHLSVVF